MAEAQVTSSSLGFICSISYMTYEGCDLDFYIKVCYKVSKQEQLQCKLCNTSKAECSDKSEGFLCLYHFALDLYRNSDYVIDGKDNFFELENRYFVLVDKIVNDTNQSGRLAIVSNIRKFQWKNIEDSPVTIVRLIKALSERMPYNNFYTFLDNGYSSLTKAMKTFMILVLELDYQQRYLFIDDIDTKHLCFLCRRVSRKAVSCPNCTTMFCYVCIVEYIEEEKCCYHCKMPLKEKKLKDLKKLRAEINQLQIMCSSYRCPTDMTFRDFHDHVKQCPSRLITPCAACGDLIIVNKGDHKCYMGKFDQRMYQLQQYITAFPQKDILEAEVVKTPGSHMSFESWSKPKNEAQPRVWLFKDKSVKFKLTLPDSPDLSPAVEKFTSKNNPNEIKILINHAEKTLAGYLFYMLGMQKQVKANDNAAFKLNLMLHTIVFAEYSIKESDFFSSDAQDTYHYLLCLSIIKPLYNKFVENDCHILVIGAHPGYLVTLLSIIIGCKGSVTGITTFSDDYEETRSNINKSHSDLLSSKRLSVVNLDMGQNLPKNKLYNFIIKKEGESYPLSKEQVASHLAKSGWFVYISSKFPGIVATFEKDKDGNLAQCEFNVDSLFKENRKAFMNFLPHF